MTKYHKHKLDLIRETCDSERLAVCCLRCIKNKYDDFEDLIKAHNELKGKLYKLSTHCKMLIDNSPVGLSIRGVLEEIREI